MARILKSLATLAFVLGALHGCSKCSTDGDLTPENAMELPPPVELNMPAPGIGTTIPSEPEASMDAAPDLDESMSTPRPETRQ